MLATRMRTPSERPRSRLSTCEKVQVPSFEVETDLRFSWRDHHVVVIVVLLALLLFLLLLWLRGWGGGGGGGWGWEPHGPDGPDDGLAAVPERERTNVT